MKPILAAFFFVLSTLCVLQQQHVVVVATAVGTGLAVSSNTATATGVKLIEEACQHSVHKNVCISTLKNDPNSKGANLTGLAYIAIRRATTYASSIDMALREMYVNYMYISHPPEEHGLEDCVGFYSDANRQLENSVAALSKKAYNDVEKWMNDAIANSNSCDQSLISIQRRFMMAPKNQGFRQLCFNVLAIIKVLAHK